MYWKLAKWALMVGSSLLVVALIYNAGYSRGHNLAELTHKEVLAKLAQKHAEETADALHKQAMVAKALAEKSQGILKEKNRELNHVVRSRDALALQLRERRSREDQARSATDSAGSNAGQPGGVCTGRELSREDAEFLVGEAAKADALRGALKAQREIHELIIKENTDASSTD
jgi:hypothetical protein